MTERGDYQDEMSLPEFTDEAVEAFLTGHRHPELDAEPGLVAFADDVQTVAATPAPEPDLSVLGAFLSPAHRNGHVDEAETARATIPSTAAVPEAWRPRPPATPAPLFTRPDSRRAKVLPLRRRAGIGAVAGVAAALVASSVAVAGTTGTLPDPVQRAFVTVVEAITPFEIPGPADRAPVAPAGPAADPATGPASTGTPGPAGGAGASPETGPGTDVAGLDRAAQTPAGTVGNLPGSGNPATPGTPGPPAGTPGPPASVDPGPPAGVDPGPPAGVDPGPPASVDPGPPASLDPGPPASLDPGPPADIDPGPPASVNPGPPEGIGASASAGPPNRP